ncbi:MAG: universal stress protein [Rubrivivax sp.]|jgi:nucleotide-binding universal stress UspA family protein|nr:universal stress protein [Rubrivivax sp.]
MYQRILFPTDGSEATDKALEAAVTLAKLCGAELQVLSVKDPYPFAAVSEIHPIAPQEYLDAQDRAARSCVGRAVAVAESAGVKASGCVVEAVHPWEAIVEQAQTQGCDLIVMASHGRRGIAALLLGSETTRVLTHTQLPVLVVR